MQLTVAAPAAVISKTSLVEEIGPCSTSLFFFFCYMNTPTVQLAASHTLCGNGEGVIAAGLKKETRASCRT